MTIDRVISLRKDAGIEPVVVQQNDRQSRTVRFFLMDSSGSPFPTAGRQARMLFRKNGATSPAYEADVLPDGWIRLIIPDAVMANPGTGEMQLVLADGDYLLHSFTVPFQVRPSLSFVGETESPADDPMAVNWKNLPGKPAAFPPATHSHTPAAIGALAAGGTAVNAAKLGGLAPEYYLHPHNLLDNSDFTQPINQRGESSYAGAGYTIDRWQQTNACATATLGNKYLMFRASGGAACLRQLVPVNDYMLGQTFTAAICTNGGVKTTVSAKLPEGAVTTETTLATAAAADGVSLSLTKTPEGWLCLRLDVADGKSIPLRWAALYQGSYTKDTLPPYEYKGCAAELEECQRYFRRTNAESTYATIGLGIARSATSAWINIPRKRMRIGKPSVTVTGVLKLYTGAASVDSTAISLDKISDGFIRLTVTAANLTAGAAIVATTADTATFHIDESADL